MSVGMSSYALLQLHEENKVSEDDIMETQIFGKQFNFELTIDENTRSGLRGLTPILESRLLAEFSKEEIMANPEKVLQCILEVKVLTSGAQAGYQVKDFELPESSEAQKLMQQTVIFKRENPSDKYYIVSRLAQGGFARVFHVRRIEDEKNFALKFIEPKDKNDYNSIKNEVAIMMLCKE